MKWLSLLRGEKSGALTRPSTQDQAEKLLVESFRMLGQVCTKVADFIEAQRLERSGYAAQEKFLERLDVPKGKEP